MNQQFMLMQLQAFLRSFVDQLQNEHSIQQLQTQHVGALTWHEQKIQELPAEHLIQLRTTTQRRLQKLLSDNQLIATAVAQLIRSYVPLPHLDSIQEQQMRLHLTQIGGQAYQLGSAENQIDALWLTHEKIDLHKLNVEIVSIDQAKIVAQPGCSVLLLVGNGSCYEECYPLVVWYLQRGFNVLLFNYRGSGKSTGMPSEQGYYEDAKCALQQLQLLNGSQDEHKILLHGISLGGAIALDVMQQQPHINVVLDQTFSSMGEVVNWQSQKFLAQIFGHEFPWVYTEILLHLVAQHVVFDNFTTIAKVQGHILLVRAMQDQVIPNSCATRLQSQAKQASSVHRIDTLGAHCCNWLMNDANAAAQLEQFLIAANLGRSA